MTYKPPFARMREIKQNRSHVAAEAPPPVVEDVLYTVEEPSLEPVPAPEPVPVAPEPVAPEPAPEPVAPEPEPFLEPEFEPEPEPVEPEPEPEPEATGKPFNAQMKKADLIAVANSLGVPISDEMTKAQILDALNAAFPE